MAKRFAKIQNGAGRIALFLSLAVFSPSARTAENACETACALGRGLRESLADRESLESLLQRARATLPGALVGFVDEWENVCSQGGDPLLGRLRTSLLFQEARSRDLASEPAPFVEKRLDTALLARLGQPVAASRKASAWAAIAPAPVFSPRGYALQGLFESKASGLAAQSPFGNHSAVAVCPDRKSPDLLLQSLNRCLAYQLDDFLASSGSGGAPLLNSLRAVLKKSRQGFKKENATPPRARAEFHDPLRGALWVSWLTVEALERRPAAALFANELEEVRGELRSLALRAIGTPSLTADPTSGLWPVAGLVLLSDCSKSGRLVDLLLPATFRALGPKGGRREADTHTERFVEFPPAPPPAVVPRP